jgi:hypothetical protein
MAASFQAVVQESYHPLRFASQKLQSPGLVRFVYLVLQVLQSGEYAGQGVSKLVREAGSRLSHRRKTLGVAEYLVLFQEGSGSSSDFAFQRCCPGLPFRLQFGQAMNQSVVVLEE